MRGTRALPSARPGLEVDRALQAILGLGLWAVGLAGALDVFSFETSTASLIVIAVLGGLLTTMGFADRRDGRPVNAQGFAAFDRVMAGALAVVALVFALSGEAVVAVAFAVACACLAVATLVVRYR